jgi:hypothetical protein
MKPLVDDYSPAAERLTVVLDHLKTPVPASFYAPFPPAEAPRLLRRRDFHPTPKPGSRLNRAELEFSGLSRQCVARRIGTKATLLREGRAWEATRTAVAPPVDWRFTTRDARIKLKRLYPEIHD